MLEIDRFEKILFELNEKKRMTYKELDNVIDVSLSTIKRDIEKMERKGLLNKIKGGISKINDIRSDKEVEERFGENINEKKEISVKAFKVIKNDDFIYLDAGTTVFYLIDKLKNKNITVVTNGVMHIEELTKNKIKTIIIGGEVKIETKAVVGIEALKNIEKYRFDISFLGVNGVDIDKGLMTPDIKEAILKEKILEISDTTDILADKEKFGMSSSVKFGNVENCILITDDFTDSRYNKYMLKEEI